MSSIDTENGSALEITVMASGIYLYKLSDWSDAGLEQWETSLSKRLGETAENIFSIYDMRHFETVSPRGFEFVNRLEAHPKSNYSYSAAVLKSRRLAILVDAIIGMRRNNGRNRIFFNVEDAADWLLTHKPADERLKNPTPPPDSDAADGLGNSPS